MQASFQYPNAKFLGKRENDYTPPPPPYCIEWDVFLPQTEGNFVSQDYRLRQSKKTLALTKALLFWVEKAQPSQTNKPCQLAVCVRELREAMEPLTSFTDEDVLTNDPPFPLGEDNIFERFQGRERGGPRGHKGMRWGHYAEGLSQGFLSDHPSSGTFQAPHHPHDHNGANYLHPHYPWQTDHF